MSDDKLQRDARHAYETTPDVGREAVAGVYAEAFLNVGESAGATASLVETLDSLVDDVLDSFPDFEELLDSQLISFEEKVELLDRIFGPRVPAIFLNFLKVVARHERLDCLRAIQREVRQQYDERLGRVPVRLTAAAPIPAEMLSAIETSLKALVADGEPVLDYNPERDTDPDLVGGAVLRIGDTVYDGSIATVLQNVRKQMIDRSVHEIQSRRDRFRDPTGN
ncbi:MAG: ATP synthase F1 subunit delta [Planctomycetia bacterium]|jgi:F-type H+-transporting ATPase subunit delta